MPLFCIEDVGQIEIEALTRCTRGESKMLNETVTVQEAIDRLRSEFDEGVLTKCRELLNLEFSGIVPEKMRIVDLLSYVHQADDIVHQPEIEAAVYAQSNGFNSDP